MHVLVVTYRSPLESIVIAAPEKKTDIAASQSHVLNLLEVIFFFQIQKTSSVIAL